MQSYLKETWVPTLRSSIRQCLNNINKGWFNLEETNLEVYQGSKLKKLMELTKFAMQVQDKQVTQHNYTATVACIQCIYRLDTFLRYLDYSYMYVLYRLSSTGGFSK